LNSNGSENVTEHLIPLHGLAFEVLPAHSLSKNGTLYLLGAFGTTPTASLLGLWHALFGPFVKAQDRLRELVCPHNVFVRPCNMARQGVNGFGYFFTTKSSSAAGARPGNIKQPFGTMSMTCPT